MRLEVITEQPDPVTHATPVLFVHGMWMGAWCWAEQFLPYFAQHGYVAHAMSLRGHGSSEGADSLRWTSLDDYITDVIAVARQFDQPPILIGHSMGGVIVQKVLERVNAPAAVSLVSGPPGGVLAATLRIFVRHPWAVTKANLTLSMLPVVGTPELARAALFSRNMPDDQVRAYADRLQNESYRAYLDMLGLNRLHPERAQAPLLILGAADDTIFTQDDVQATARAYRADVEIFPDVGHGLILEDSWQAIADHILAWLATHDL